MCSGLPSRQWHNLKCAPLRLPTTIYSPNKTHPSSAIHPYFPSLGRQTLNPVPRFPVVPRRLSLSGHPPSFAKHLRWVLLRLCRLSTHISFICNPIIFAVHWLVVDKSVLWPISPLCKFKDMSEIIYFILIYKDIIYIVFSLSYLHHSSLHKSFLVTSLSLLS